MIFANSDAFEGFCKTVALSNLDVRWENELLAQFAHQYGLDPAIAIRVGLVDMSHVRTSYADADNLSLLHSQGRIEQSVDYVEVSRIFRL